MEYLKEQEEDQMLVKAEWEHEEGEKGGSLEKGTDDEQSNDPPKDAAAGSIHRGGGLPYKQLRKQVGKPPFGELTSARCFD